MKLSIRRLTDTAVLPSYARDGDAGLDLSADTRAVIYPGAVRLISTGISLAIPAGHVGLVHPRSGLAYKSGITVLNAPGTIDAGYRGEIMVMLWNTRDTPFNIEPGDRIAQLVVQEFVTCELDEIDALPDSVRGDRGFGSSGVAGTAIH